jgi:glycosyltransferase involved in cell wall biosynthesis
MRIVQIIHDGERGGVQTLARMIGEGLAPSGFRIETEYLYPRAGISALAKLGYVCSMVRLIWRGGYDALIAYQSSASVLVGIVGWLAGCRQRVVHQTCMPAEMPRLLRLMDLIAGALGLYSANIVNSASTWAQYAGYPARYRRSMILIEHGLDAPQPQESRAATRRRFGLPQAQPLLLNVGRVTEQKNQDVLIRALTCLPQAHLVIAGAGAKDDAFHELAVTLGIDSRLHMLGALQAQDIADLYAATDLFVFPSIWETFGLAAAEAAMAGMPMVVADLPVLREVLNAGGGEPVTFVAPRNVEEWISAIGRTLAAPPPEYVLANFARDIGRKYSRQRMIESYLSLFQAYRQHDRRDDVSALRPAAEES